MGVYPGTPGAICLGMYPGAPGAPSLALCVYPEALLAICLGVYSPLALVWVCTLEPLGPLALVWEGSLGLGVYPGAVSLVYPGGIERGRGEIASDSM